MLRMTNILPEWLTAMLVENRVTTDGLILKDRLLEKKKRRDFELEWEEHREKKMTRTWGFEAQKRLEQLFLETDSSPDEISQLTILDAGCGNGLLTGAIASLGAKVIGVDIIDNLELITKERRKPDTLFFLHADIQNLPFKESSFDLIISNGVLHHTPDTKNSFLQLAKLVKPGGKFYVWLYRKPFKLKNRLLLFGFDIVRNIVSHLPKQLQKPIVSSIAKSIFLVRRFRKRKDQLKGYNDLLIDLYDSLTPRYRHYHTPIELAGWFREACFSAPVLSHWDNSFGFGMYAHKTEGWIKTPGENYDKDHPDFTRHLS